MTRMRFMVLPDVVQKISALAIRLKSECGIGGICEDRPMLDPEQKHRLRKTFALVERQSHVAALVFYQRLFELDPSLRPLFKTDIEVQATKLIDMLGSALSLLEKPEEFNEVLEELGARHVTYGVKTEHYAVTGQ